MFRDCFEVKLDMECVIIYSFDRMFGIVVIICGDFIKNEGSANG